MHASIAGQVRVGRDAGRRWGHRNGRLSWTWAVLPQPRRHHGMGGGGQRLIREHERAERRGSAREAGAALRVAAPHIKHVPGRKTGRTQLRTARQLLECGLLRWSLVPGARVPRRAGPHVAPQGTCPRVGRSDQLGGKDPGTRQHQAGLGDDGHHWTGGLKRSRSPRATEALWSFSDKPALSQSLVAPLHRWRGIIKE